MKQHLFILGADAIDAVSDEEVTATVEGLKALGLYHLPYDRVSLQLPNKYAVLMDDALDHSRKDWGMNLKLGRDGRWHLDFPEYFYIEFTNINLLGEPAHCRIVCDGPVKHSWSMDQRDLVHCQESLTDLLICLLATRNARKETKHNKLASLGIGTKHKIGVKRFEYVTTISVPQNLEEDDHTVKEGKPKAPHLRRGHIRNQHYGPGFQYVKPVWIAPVFVNADHDFVSGRKAYNLRMS